MQSSEPLVLGIETSCDETAAAIVTPSGRVLSDVIHSQIAVHAPYGGIIPELASRDHLTNLDRVVNSALQAADVSYDELTGIAVTNRPGLVGALLVGVQFAKTVAWAKELPLVGVDHLMGHIVSAFLRRDETARTLPEFPFIALLVSGGHTALYLVRGPRAADIQELGATRDDAAGEAFDKVGKLLGLGYPGGPVIDRLAILGDRKKVLLKSPSLPHYEFSFSGLKSQVARWVESRKGLIDEEARNDLCASFQSTVVDVLARKTVSAVLATGVKHVVLGGGVSANRGLRERMTREALKHGFMCHLPTLADCTDNAAMIAYAGSLRLCNQERDGWDLLVTSKTILPRTTRKGGGPR